MFKILPLVVVLLNLFSFCTTPSEAPFQNSQDHFSVTHSDPYFQQPDTAGLCQSYLNALAEPDGVNLPIVPPSSWGLLAFTGPNTGMIPVSTFFEDSIRFQVLFFRKDSTGYQFYTADREPPNSNGFANR